MMMPVPMKMKTNVCLPVAAASTLIMIALLFKEIPVHVVAAASPGPQGNQYLPTRQKPHKSRKVNSSVEGSATGGRQSLKADSPLGPDTNRHVPTPPQQHKVHSSTGASGAGGRQSVKVDDPPGTNPDHHVPTPPQQHNVHSSIGASAAGGYPTCSRSTQCNSHVPTPGCCSRQSKKEHQVRVNTGKAGLMRDYKTSMNARKHAPADHTCY